VNDMLLDVLRIDLMFKLLLATVLGGVIGWEREASGKPAGLRTNILICIGAALLTELSIYFSTISDGVARWDPARITAQIVSGIGFLGAGTIMQARGTVTGLTTAATLWVVAAIGMVVGAGAYVEATGATLMVLIVLIPMSWVEDRIETQRRGRSIRVVLSEAGNVEEIFQLLEGSGLTVRQESVIKGREGEKQATFEVRGSSGEFRAARAMLQERADVRAIFRG
jgi:putative Mg2+ transporter-C (MgtC) family protein